MGVGVNGMSVSSRSRVRERLEVKISWSPPQMEWSGSYAWSPQSASLGERLIALNVPQPHPHSISLHLPFTECPLSFRTSGYGQ